MSISAYKAKNGATLNGIDLNTFRNIVKELQESFFLSPLQISESAGFSMAMVVRYALGLDASGGQILCLTRNTLSGAVAAATLRHLVNGGANAMIGIEAEPDANLAAGDPIQSAYLKQLEALNALEVPIFLFPQVEKAELEAGINNSHNVILGVYDHNSDNHVKDLWPLIDSLNESATPIHTIGAPLAVDVDTGAGLTNPLYASSTLSLGAPFDGFGKGKDLIGRHYVCDISIPKVLRDKYNIGAENLFSEQPVVGIELVE